MRLRTQRKCCNLDVTSPPPQWGRYQHMDAASLPHSIACIVRTDDYAEDCDVSMVHVE